MKCNWYKTAYVYKDSGIKDIIPYALFSAIVAVTIGGTSIWQATKQFNVSEQEIQKALQNPQIIDAVKNYDNQYAEEETRKVLETTYDEKTNDEKIEKPKTTISPTQIDINKIVQIESSGNPNAVGKAGERGLTQILNEKTWDWIVKDMNQKWTWDQAFDGEKNKAVGDHYINVIIPRMLKRYNIPDTIETRIGAYNWGIGNVNTAYKSEGSNWTSKLPSTTKNYIQKYL